MRASTPMSPLVAIGATVALYLLLIVVAIAALCVALAVPPVVAWAIYHLPWSRPQVGWIWVGGAILADAAILKNFIGALAFLLHRKTQGVRVDARTAPAVMAAVDAALERVREAGFEVRPFTGVSVVAEPAAATSYAYGARHLEIGWPLVEYLPPDELAAVIAHEAGHHRGSAMLFHNALWRIHATLGRLLARTQDFADDAKREIKASSLFYYQFQLRAGMGTFGLYVIIFALYAVVLGVTRVTRGLGHATELSCDSTAAIATSPEAIVGALFHVTEIHMTWKRFTQRRQRGAPVGDGGLVREFRAFVGAPVRPAVDADALREICAIDGPQHPSTRTRAAAFGLDDGVWTPLEWRSHITEPALETALDAEFVQRSRGDDLQRAKVRTCRQACRTLAFVAPGSLQRIDPELLEVVSYLVERHVRSRGANWQEAVDRDLRAIIGAQLRTGCGPHGALAEFLLGAAREEVERSGPTLSSHLRQTRRLAIEQLEGARLGVQRAQSTGRSLTRSDLLALATAAFEAIDYRAPTEYLILEDDDS